LLGFATQLVGYSVSARLEVYSRGENWRPDTRLRREDAERPEALRVPPGDWRGLLVVWYFNRHGLDPLARTFLVGVILIVGGLVMLAATR